MLLFGVYQIGRRRPRSVAAGDGRITRRCAWHALRVLFGASRRASRLRATRYTSSGSPACSPRRVASRGSCGPGVPRAGRAAARAAIVVDLLGVRDLYHADTRQSDEVVAVLPCGAITRGRRLRARTIVGTTVGRDGDRPGRRRSPHAVDRRGHQPGAAAADGVPQRVASRAHGLTYGLAGFWRLQFGHYLVRQPGAGPRRPDGRSPGSSLYLGDNTLSFDASRYDANFVIIDLAGNGLSPFAERARQASADRPPGAVGDPDLSEEPAQAARYGRDRTMMLRAALAISRPGRTAHQLVAMIFRLGEFQIVVVRALAADARLFTPPTAPPGSDTDAAFRPTMPASSASLTAGPGSVWV